MNTEVKCSIETRMLERPFTLSHIQGEICRARVVVSLLLPPPWRHFISVCFKSTCSQPRPQQPHRHPAHHRLNAPPWTRDKHRRKLSSIWSPASQGNGMVTRNLTHIDADRRAASRTAVFSQTTPSNAASVPGTSIASSYRYTLRCWQKHAGPHSR
jgi:hypothetical protein